MPYAKDLRDPNVPWEKYRLKLSKKEEQNKLIQEIMKTDRVKARRDELADRDEESEGDED